MRHVVRAGSATARVSHDHSVDKTPFFRGISYIRVARAAKAFWKHSVLVGWWLYGLVVVAAGGRSPGWRAMLIVNHASVCETRQAGLVRAYQAYTRLAQQHGAWTS